MRLIGSKETLTKDKMPEQDGGYWVGLAKDDVWGHIGGGCKCYVPCVYYEGQFRMLVPDGMFIKTWVRQPEEYQEHYYETGLISKEKD